MFFILKLIQKVYHATKSNIDPIVWSNIDNFRSRLSLLSIVHLHQQADYRLPPYILMMLVIKDVFKTLYMYSSSGSTTSSVVYMNSLFRLIATCERVQHKGALEGIDALLGNNLISFLYQWHWRIHQLSSDILKPF